MTHPDVTTTILFVCAGGEPAPQPRKRAVRPTLAQADGRQDRLPHRKKGILRSQQPPAVWLFVIRVKTRTVDKAVIQQFIDAAVRDHSHARQLLDLHPELLEARYLRGETVLHFLALENFVEGVRFLAQAGAAVDATSGLDIFRSLTLPSLVTMPSPRSSSNSVRTLTLSQTPMTMFSMRRCARRTHGLSIVADRWRETGL